MSSENYLSSKNLLSLIKPKSVWSLIPARSGSKRISNKNLRKINNIPLLLYSIIASKTSKNIHQTFVSTDSKTYANLAKKYNAKVPFLRPKKLSQDNSSDDEFVIHFLQNISKYEKCIPEYIVSLRPTTPFRNIKYLNKAINLFIKSKTYTSLRSSHLENHPPEKLFRIKNNVYTNINFKKISEKSNYPSDLFAKTYKPNGYIDIISTKNFLNTKNLYGNKIKPFITEPVIDIDQILDLKIANSINIKEKINIIKLIKKNE